MKQTYLLCLLSLMLACTSLGKEYKPDQSKHAGLVELEATYPFPVLYSDGVIAEARQQAELVGEAYQMLKGIMGPKDNFCLLVIAGEDWERNAYSPVVGMPEYYKGNLIVGAGHSEIAAGYEEMIASFPSDMTTDLMETYINDQGELDMGLFFDKLSIHELTHSFQDPQNREGYSMSRWLEEIHANMGLYAFYKTKRPDELKYVLSLVNFSLENPPPELAYTSLTDFDDHYYEISPPNYGQYQMRFTKAAQLVIDSLGNNVLQLLNDFLIKYDESWKEKLTEEEFKAKLTTEVDPYLVQIMDSW